MSKSLVIVESPAKAKTIEKYLGKGFEVRASVGHIMDLPKNDIGVELEKRTFVPELVVSPGKEKVVEQLKKLAAKSDEIYLAPDPVLRPQEVMVLEILRQDASLQIDEVLDALETQLTSSEVFTALFELEMAGRIRQLPGKNYVRTMG